MTRDLLLATYSEIYLKGLNRPFFLRLLLSRVRDAVRPLGATAALHDSRLLISGMDDTDACVEKLRKVFGIHSVFRAVEMEKDDFNAVCRQAANMMEGLTGTFKVAARRADKRYVPDSPQMCAAAGDLILRRCSNLRVDVKRPAHVLNIEIRDKAYLYVRVFPGAGGMPVGSNGRAALLLSGGIDSPVAGYLTAKRGVELCAVHFHSFPYTGERSKQKVISLAGALSEYCCGLNVYVVPFTELQTRIHEKCPPAYATLVMRRLMMRIASLIAQREGAQALVTGESIGQVASQTMDALCCTDAAADRPVFRPLIGFDKIEIIERAKAIGTYDLSCLPYEDCCTVFTPRHPVTHPKLERAVLAENALGDVSALIREATDAAEIIVLPGPGQSWDGDRQA